MSFTIRSTFSTNYWSLGSVQVPSYGARPVSSSASIYAGAGGSGSWISRGIGFVGLAAGTAGGLAGMGGIQNDKEAMQSLNDSLASYLDRVRSLETENRKLEIKIREHLEKKGPPTIEDQRAQIFTNTVDNARIVLQIDNARLAADDFGVKYETELVMHHSVENDIHGLRKVTDDTNPETEIEALKEDQIASSGLTVEVDAPKSQHLAKIIADIRAQYDELDLNKYWSQQTEENTTLVTTQTAEVGAAEMPLMELRHTVQSLEIDLDSMRNLKASLENSLREVEARYALQMEQLNGILLHLESEVAQTRAEGQRQAQALLNIKVKLEAEIATYRRLLEDGKDFNLGDALNSSSSMQTMQKTATRRTVDGKVVYESNDTKVLRH
uniref:IF rod domain-containing protein n=1 Tax=Cercocebus atys TaxID=9531 RepID=A0A2K5NL20_CERAT